MAMTLVSSVTIGSGGAANIEWTNLPQSGKDLLILFSLRSSRSGTVDYVDITFNSSTSNYSGRALLGDGSTAYGFTETIYSGEMPAASTTSNVFGSGHAYIPNYSGNTTKSHSVDTVTENNATYSTLIFMAKLWSDTSAITSVRLSSRFANMVQHSSASLYIIS